MLYHTANQPLIEFMRNPLKSIDYVKGKFSSPRKRSRLLYKIPFLRKYITDNEVENLFRAILICIAEKAEVELKGIEATPVAYGEKHLKDCMSELATYFFLDVQSNLPDLDVDTKLLHDHAYSHFNAKMEYHCNRIMETFSLKAEHSRSILRCRNLWSLFYLSEFLFLLETGQMILTASSTGFEIKKSSGLQHQFRSYWLSEVCEANSKHTDIFSIALLNESIQNQTRVSPLLLNSHIDLLLDKIFSINTNHLTSTIRGLPAYKLLRDIVGLSLLVETLCGENRCVEKQLIYTQRILMDENIEFIDAFLFDAENKKFGSFSNFITYDGKYYHRGSLGFKFGIKRFVGALLHEYKNENKSFFDKYGDSFQDDYVVPRLKALTKYGYVAIDGFEPDSPNAKIRGYDVDAVLHDVVENKFYFIQIKYCASFIPTYLAEQSDFFNHNTLKDGYRQLDILRKNFADESVRKILHSKGLANATLTNSHFLLIHNIPFLNFYEYEGIYLYEWNLLRNILREGLGLKVSRDGAEEKYVGKKFQLHNPYAIVDEYIGSGLIENGTENLFQLFSSSKCCLDVLGEKIVCDMI